MRNDLDSVWREWLQDSTRLVDVVIQNLGALFEKEESYLRGKLCGQYQRMPLVNHLETGCIDLAPIALSNLLANMNEKAWCIKELVETASEELRHKIE
jgi:hypothetical protein